MIIENSASSSNKKLPGFDVITLTTNRRAINVFKVIFAVLPIALALPVDALQVKVTPTNPKLGDTLSVEISLDNPENGTNPTVASGKNTYPAFEIAPNQYRAFVPTTPLETAGNRTLRIAGDG